MQFINSHNYRGIDISGLKYNFDQGFYSLNQLGHRFALVNFQYYPIIWTVNDKSFLAWMQRDGDPYNNESMLLVFDHASKKISESFAWGEITPPDADVHLQPTIIGTNDDKVLMLVENPHDGPVNIKKSGSNYDITTNDYFGFFGDDLAYPHTQKLENGDLYSVFRGSGGVFNDVSYRNYTRMDCYKSTDNGESWSKTGVVMYTESRTDNEELFYPQMPFSNDKIRVFVNRRIRILGTTTFIVPYLYYLESNDGVVWTNVSGDSHWNIENGPIPMRLMDDKFLAIKYNNGIPENGKGIKAIGSCINNYGYPMALVKERVGWGINMVYWDGSSWIEKPVNPPGHTLLHADSSPLICTKSNIIRAFITEQVGDYTQISEFVSYDFGDTWEWKRQITEGDVNHVNPHLSGNFQETGYGLFGAVVKTDPNNYSDLYLKEIM